MRVSDEDESKLFDGVGTALDMMVDDEISAVIIVGTHTDGRGFKLWSAGNEKVNDHIRLQLLRILPLPPDLDMPREPDEDDGA